MTAGGFLFGKIWYCLNMEPLASKIRPKNLKEFVGQTHIAGKDKPLAVAIKQKHLFSFILWGPPGVGKTTLAKIYARSLKADLFELSAVSAGKADIKKILSEETNNKKPKILFLDEIHRFNKAQQDFLLPYVESGELILIGATTENPSFEIIPALLSRMRVFVLEELSGKEMATIVKRTGFTLDKKALDWIIAMATGDARQAITVLENTSDLYGKITVETLKETLQSKFLRYDKKGDEHYNVISALHKSMRGSDADASLYWLVRMIEGGEDPLYIARRLIRFASEDIGIANSRALDQAVSAYQACHFIGYPECNINLAQAVVYMAKSKKSNELYEAYQKVAEDVRKFGNLPVPLHIRNAPTKLMKDLNYGKDYKYSPDFKYEEDQEYLPEKLKNKKYLK